MIETKDVMLQISRIRIKIFEFCKKVLATHISHYICEKKKKIIFCLKNGTHSPCVLLQKIEIETEPSDTRTITNPFETGLYNTLFFIGR